MILNLIHNTKLQDCVTVAERNKKVNPRLGIQGKTQMLLVEPYRCSERDSTFITLTYAKL